MEGTEKQIRYAEKLKEEFEKNHEKDCRMIDKLLESRAEVEKKFKAEGRNYEKEVIDFLKKYVVSIRNKVEDWEIPSDFWEEDYYPDPHIEADCPEDAEDTARDFIQDCGDDPDKYDYLVTEYEE